MESNASTDAKKKFKIRPRQIKRALAVTFYAFVAIVTVLGMVSPMLRF